MWCHQARTGAAEGGVTRCLFPARGARVLAIVHQLERSSLSTGLRGTMSCDDSCLWSRLPAMTDNAPAGC
jgi:hypothetical protein